jgi:hypothetical protein
MFYKFIICSVFFSIVVLAGYCQPTSFDQTNANDMKIFDSNGKLFVNPNADIAGSPFFIEGWKYGIITMSNNRPFSRRLLRLDVERQEIHYLSENNTEMYVGNNYIKQVAFTDSAHLPVTQYNFQSGFPSIDEQDEKYLYSVICDGNVKMIESIRKRVITNKNDLTGEMSKEYRTYEDYYLYTDKSIQRLKKDKTFLLNLMISKKDKIEAFVNSNKLNYKSVEDVKKIINYYNSNF